MRNGKECILGGEESNRALKFSELVCRTDQNKVSPMVERFLPIGRKCIFYAKQWNLFKF